MIAAPTLEAYRRLSRMTHVTARNRPLVSLITVTLNAADTIARTIDSVQAQTFRDIEHIIVDGGSTDGTSELAQKALRQHDVWVSEPDRGISDAFNKGVALSSGQYVQFINADDWLSPEQVAVAVAGLESSGADFVFGDLIFYRDGQPNFRYCGDPNYVRLIRRCMPALNHPTVLARRAAFDRIGLFDLRYRCAMDYDWFYRLHLAGGRGVYLPELVGHMNHDGVSNLHYARTYREVEAIAVSHGHDPRVARLERYLRLAKTGMARQLQESAQPLYRLIRRQINRAYAPLHATSAVIGAPRDVR